jgi:hypothetical protein
MRAARRTGEALGLLAVPARRAVCHLLKMLPPALSKDGIVLQAMTDRAERQGGR